MCGIIAIVGRSDVAASLYEGLTVLQHRGQDAAGIATSHRGRVFLAKDNGLVRDVFNEDQLQTLAGDMGLAHCRYPTAGSSDRCEAQPLYVNSPYGIVLAHNGNLINDGLLREALFSEDRRHLNTDSDSEVLLNVFAHELALDDQPQLAPEQIFHAVEAVHKRVKGAYAAVAMIPNVGVVGFRDPHGIRPMVLGERKTDHGPEYALASESVALDLLGFRLVRDVAPGEVIFISHDGLLHNHRCTVDVAHTPCIFELVYLARPDSMMDDISVYKARLRMGEQLADKILRMRPQHDIDVVIPVPDTSRTCALPLANKLGVKYREGFIKNRYVGRTFIMPGQTQRVRSVRRKLNAIDLEFRGKNVLIVDDSIVRGTTSKQIIQMARDAGANKVYFASAAPPVRFPNIYGIDMPTPDELIAHGREIAEIQRLLGADWLIYQDLGDLIEACLHHDTDVKAFDTSCFSNEYVTGVSPEYLRELGLTRSDIAKATRLQVVG